MLILSTTGERVFYKFSQSLPSATGFDEFLEVAQICSGGGVVTINSLSKVRDFSFNYLPFYTIFCLFNASLPLRGLTFY